MKKWTEPEFILVDVKETEDMIRSRLALNLGTLVPPADDQVIPLSGQNDGI
ncbi:hypothetical protein [Butyrivibrio sp. YAB3001]|uniref:hypothetical protein n=1 Tax=Butyrivibrio sp. YAB3001 TaxID=1520812 RepID=UPI0008F645D8|nr:hypothetical protein [Butyrivibrio sp. YAB3001]SFC34936.1 hypothetical protein SAMN02910398_02059 [Butyrivibrio sp. YAB3001]